MADIRLGHVHLDDSRFEWPFYRGATPRKPVIIRQDARQMPLLLSLPRVTYLEFEASAEDGVNDPAHETLRVDGVRILWIDQLNDERTCEIALGTCRDDLALRVNDADANLLFKDGYLDTTEFDRIGDWLRWVMRRIPELESNADMEWEAGALAAPILPDQLPVAGPNLMHAIDALCEVSGVDFYVGSSGTWKLIPVDGTSLKVLPSSYSWVSGFEPSWYITSRTSRDLPKEITFNFAERHAVRLYHRVMPQTGKTSAPPMPSTNPLDVRLVQVYQTDAGFKSLFGLLDLLGYRSDAIDDDTIARVLTTRNFENTPLERGKSPNSERIINIIKRDWRRLFKIDYPAQGGIGRSGGWTDWQFGLHEERPDKEGNLRVTGQVTAQPVRCAYTEYLEGAEYHYGFAATSEGAVVARSRRRRGNGPLPAAPFSVHWVSEGDEVLRITPNDAPGVQMLWPGEMAVGRTDHAGNLILVTETRDYVIDGNGNRIQLPYPELHVPTPEDVRFNPFFELEIFAVATRRLPNTHEKWTQVKVPFQADGGVEVMEVEVGHELYALRDYVDPLAGKSALADGLGAWLNLPELEQDAQDRGKILKDRLALTRAGNGTAQGVSLAMDHDVHGAISEIRIAVDYPVILTEIDVGLFSTERTRLERKRKRDAMRSIKHGGMPAV